MISKRYETLDGLRGVAAIGVMIFHFSILGVGQLLPRGFLAVDLFFALSGFALSCAYEKTAQTISISQFFKKRLIRILPLSVLGLTIGTLYFFIRARTQANSFYNLPDILFSYFLNLLLLPKFWITPAPTDTVFPANTPLWSLSLEMMVNMVWIVGLIRLPTRKLWIITVAACLLLSVIILSHGTADLGATWITYSGGVLRACFGFCAGILIWRHHPKVSSSRIGPHLSIFILMAMFAYSGGGVIFELLSIIILIPSLLYFTIRTDCGERRPIYRYFGNISYSLYTIHVPFLMIFVGICKVLHVEHLPFVINLACAMLIILCSSLINQYYDAPLQRFLNKRLKSMLT